MKISVVIPAYNAEKHIRRAIDSVLSQTRPADEVIIVDDGSADTTAEAVRLYGDKVTLFQQENAGVSVARNTGIRMATGDWIAFLDADDEWLPEKLELQSKHIDHHPDLKWMYSNFYRKESSIEDIQEAHHPARSTELLSEGSIKDYLHAYVNHAYAWTSTILIHKSVFKTVGLFEPGMKRAQDNDLWYRIAYQYPQVGYLVEPTAIYHLDTLGSSTKINDSVDFMTGLVQRHEELSRQYGRYEAFRPCISQMTQIWIRQLEKQHRRKDAALILEYFETYVSKRFRREMRFRMAIPFIGPIIIKMINCVKEKRRCR